MVISFFNIVSMTIAIHESEQRNDIWEQGTSRLSWIGWKALYFINHNTKAGKSKPAPRVQTDDFYGWLKEIQEHESIFDIAIKHRSNTYTWQHVPIRPSSWWHTSWRSPWQRWSTHQQDIQRWSWRCGKQLHESINKQQWVSHHPNPFSMYLHQWSKEQ